MTLEGTQNFMNSYLKKTNHQRKTVQLRIHQIFNIECTNKRITDLKT